MPLAVRGRQGISFTTGAGYSVFWREGGQSYAVIGGLSRDDAGKFLPSYIEQGMLKDDPCVVLDQPGVGQLVEMGVKKGRAARPSLKIGICGEHGGEPQSVGFFHRAGLDYVSCSPYRVPIARLAAAHVALGQSLSDTV